MSEMALTADDLVIVGPAASRQTCSAAHRPGKGSPTWHPRTALPAHELAWLERAYRDFTGESVEYHAGLSDLGVADP
jgi:hypothetical protein